MGQIIVSFLVVFFIAFIVFLILRELMCWYWKINRVITLLESIDYKLSSSTNASTIRMSQHASGAELSSGSVPKYGEEICPFCKESSLKSNAVCENCGKTKR